MKYSCTIWLVSITSLPFHLITVSDTSVWCPPLVKHVAMVQWYLSEWHKLLLYCTYGGQQSLTEQTPNLKRESNFNIFCQTGIFNIRTARHPIGCSYKNKVSRYDYKQKIVCVFVKQDESVWNDSQHSGAWAELLRLKSCLQNHCSLWCGALQFNCRLGREHGGFCSFIPALKRLWFSVPFVCLSLVKHDVSKIVWLQRNDKLNPEIKYFLLL